MMSTIFGESQSRTMLGVRLALLAFAMLLTHGATASAARVTLEWDANAEPSLGGYYLHVGFTSGNYNAKFDLGKRTIFTMTGLQPGTSYFFALTAYNSSGTGESSFSNEVFQVTTDADLMADFGGNGLWRYSGGWIEETALNPGKIAAWDEGLGVDLGAALGLQSFDGASWASLTPWQPAFMTSWQDKLVVAFGSGRGLWTYDNGGWKFLTSWDPVKVVDWGDKLVVAFGSGRGLWTYNGANWANLTTWDPYDVVAWGAELVAAFDAGRGLFALRNGSWRQLAVWEPARMSLWGSKLVVAFGSGRGLWTRDATSWQNLTPWDPYDIGSWNNFLVASFDAGRGIWRHNGTAWAQLSTSQPTQTMATGSTLYAATASGLYSYAGGTWTQMTILSPESMSLMTPP